MTKHMQMNKFRCRKYLLYKLGWSALTVAISARTVCVCMYVYMVDWSENNSVSDTIWSKFFSTGIVRLMCIHIILFCSCSFFLFCFFFLILFPLLHVLFTHIFCTSRHVLWWLHVISSLGWSVSFRLLKKVVCSIVYDDAAFALL